MLSMFLAFTLLEFFEQVSCASVLEHEISVDLQIRVEDHDQELVQIPSFHDPKGVPRLVMSSLSRLLAVPQTSEEYIKLLSLKSDVLYEVLIMRLGHFSSQL